MKNSNQVEQLTETPDLMGADLDDKAKVWLNDLLWQQRQARLGQSDAASSWSKDCVFLGALGLQSKPVWDNQMVSNEYHVNGNPWFQKGWQQTSFLQMWKDVVSFCSSNSGIQKVYSSNIVLYVFLLGRRFAAKGFA